MTQFYCDGKPDGRGVILTTDRPDPDGHQFAQAGTAELEDGTLVHVIRKGSQDTWGPWERM